MLGNRDEDGRPKMVPKIFFFFFFGINDMQEKEPVSRTDGLGLRNGCSSVCPQGLVLAKVANILLGL